MPYNNSYTAYELRGKRKDLNSSVVAEEMLQSDFEKRARIFEMVSNYVKAKPVENFKPGETWIRYAGRVFDDEEYVSVIDAVLDGWITAGRYTEEFEYQFSKFLSQTIS